MNSYTESLGIAKKIIGESSISGEDKAFLSELVPKLTPDMLEVFVWTLEDGTSDISTLVQKTRRLVAASGDEAELQKAIDEDKKAIEALIEVEEPINA